MACLQRCMNVTFYVHREWHTAYFYYVGYILYPFACGGKRGCAYLDLSISTQTEKTQEKWKKIEQNRNGNQRYFRREHIILPILWRFGKLNFTFLGSLRRQSRCPLWRQSSQMWVTLVYFGTLVYLGTLVYFSTLPPTPYSGYSWSRRGCQSRRTRVTLVYFSYRQSRGCRSKRQPKYMRVTLMYFGTFVYLGGAEFENEAPENRYDSTLPFQAPQSRYQHLCFHDRHLKTFSTNFYSATNPWGIFWRRTMFDWSQRLELKISKKEKNKQWYHCRGWQMKGS